MATLLPAAKAGSLTKAVTRARRPYTTAEYRYLAQHYAQQSAAACARALGRTVGSVYHFVAYHPELRKQGRL